MQLDNMTSLDPQEGFEAVGTEIIGNLYQRLVMPNPANPQEVIGDLAVSWEVANDSKTFTFHLNPKAKFADGSPVTAADAAFSLQRAVKLDKSPAFIINQFGFTKDNVEQHITAPDDSTLVINLDKPAAETFLLYCLSAPVGSIVQKKSRTGESAKRRSGQPVAEAEQRRFRPVLTGELEGQRKHHFAEKRSLPGDQRLQTRAD
ncbi:hypothetical protein DZJ_02110 [Dickeya ananatis]